MGDVEYLLPVKLSDVILKNSKELLDHLKSPNFNLNTNIKSFDFSTLYTTIPHLKLKCRLATIIRNSSIHKNGNRRYKYTGSQGTLYCEETLHWIMHNQDARVSKWQYFRGVRGKVFPKDNRPMCTNFVSLLANIFLYSYEAEFIQSLLSAGRKRLASQFKFTYRFIDDVLSINNPDL